MKYFSYAVTSALLGLAGVLHSYPFAYAAVLSLIVTVSQVGYGQFLEAKVFKTEIPEEVKKRLQMLEQRTTSIEIGIKNRGF